MTNHYEIPGQVTIFEELAVQDAQTAAAEAAQARAERDTDTTDFETARQRYGIESDAPNVLERRAALLGTLSNLKEANRRVGAAYMSDANPHASEFDMRFGQGRGDGRRRVAENAENFDIKARSSLLRACGECAVVGCELRDSIVRFRERYPDYKARTKFAKKLEKNPAEPC